MTSRSFDDSPESLRAQADACRRLARSVSTKAAAGVLNQLAAAHDRRADALEPDGAD
jgi:hypothetical protein